MPRLKSGGGEFDEGFSFEVPGMTSGASKIGRASPWEFGSALANARTDGAEGATTIDEKIAARLARRKRGRDDDDDDESSSGGDEEEASDDDDDDEESSSGEEDNDDVGNSSDDEDEEDDGNESSDEGSSDDDEDAAAAAAAAAAAPRTPPSAKAVGAVGVSAAAAKAKARAKADASSSSSEDEDEDNDSDSDSDSDSEEEEEEEEEERDDSEDELGARKKRQASSAAANAAATAAASKKGNDASSSSFAPAPRGTAFSAASFAALQLSRPLLKACSALGYSRPTPIQAACIPLALLGRDIAGSAVTGSGKTAAFALPLLERLLLLTGNGAARGRLPATYVLILEPTRELAAQVHSMVCSLAQFTDIRAALSVGGLSLQAQASDLRTKPEVVVATPGRLVDHLRNSPTFGLDDLQALVLDEADRLLDMGFRDEVEQIVRAAPRERQTLLFSATLASAAVARLVAASLTRPVRLAADAACAAPAALSHEVVRLKGPEGAASREAAALALCASAAVAAKAVAAAANKKKKGENSGDKPQQKDTSGGALRRGRAILFFRTKASAHRAKVLFGLAGLPRAAELHGNMTQAARLEALEAFRTGKASFLLATDVAARGLDVLGVEAVLNVDAPPDVASYLHRAGRTARAGAKGRVVTLAADADRALLKKVARSASVKLSARVVSPDSLNLWRDAVSRMEPDVRALARAEAEEAALRKAEMEAAKAENMLQHGDEIRSRAPRTWFQSAAEKKKVAEAAKEEALAEVMEVGLSSEAKRAKKREEQKKKRAEARASERASAKKAKRDEALALASKAAIRAVKSGARRLTMEQGISSGRAGKIAAAAVSGRSAESSKKKKRDAKKKKEKKASAMNGGGGGDGDGDGDSLFSSPQKTPSLPRSAKVYAGGGRSGALKLTNLGAKKRSKEEAKRAARGGKGKSRFKSKAKHKRRK